MDFVLHPFDNEHQTSDNELPPMKLDALNAQIIAVAQRMDLPPYTPEGADEEGGKCIRIYMRLYMARRQILALMIPNEIPCHHFRYLLRAHLYGSGSISLAVPSGNAGSNK